MRIFKMEACIKFKCRFNSKDCIHFGTYKLEKIFNAGMTKVSSIHKPPTNCSFPTTNVDYVSLWGKLCHFMVGLCQLMA
jgi:hypothetical protein